MVAQVTGAYADIYTWENLYTAYRKAAKGKRSRRPAAAFEFKLEDNLIQLQEELATETYRPGLPPPHLLFGGDFLPPPSLPQCGGGTETALTRRRFPPFSGLTFTHIFLHRCEVACVALTKIVSSIRPTTGQCRARGGKPRLVGKG